MVFLGIIFHIPYSLIHSVVVHYRKKLCRNIYSHYILDHYMIMKEKLIWIYSLLFEATYHIHYILKYFVPNYIHKLTRVSNIFLIFLHKIVCHFCSNKNNIRYADYQQSLYNVCQIIPSILIYFSVFQIDMDKFLDN